MWYSDFPTCNLDPYAESRTDVPEYSGTHYPLNSRRINLAVPPDSKSKEVVVSGPNREGDFRSQQPKCPHGVFRGEWGTLYCSICQKGEYQRSQPLPVEASIRSIGSHESEKTAAEVEDAELTEADTKNEWFESRVQEEIEKLQPTEGEA